MNRRLAGTRWARRSLYIAPGDKRGPMERLLVDCMCHDGTVQISYEQQFRTMFKGQRLGYLDDTFPPRLTDAGRAYLAALALKVSA